jgi:SsrA-binding protein
MAKKEKFKEVRIRNRKATHEYTISQEWTAGMSLTGAEVKSLREGKANFSDAHCILDRGSLYIKNLHIAEFKNAGYMEQSPKRLRQLLLNKSELRKIEGKVKEKGFTIIPIEIFFSDTGFAKIKIALAKGKKFYDKREDLKQKDLKRDMDRY